MCDGLQAMLPPRAFTMQVFVQMTRRFVLSEAVVLIALAIVKLRRSRPVEGGCKMLVVEPYARLLQEDTEGILDMLSMRAGEPIAGGVQGRMAMTRTSLLNMRVYMQVTSSKRHWPLSHRLRTPLRALQAAPVSSSQLDICSATLQAGKTLQSIHTYCTVLSLSLSCPTDHWQG